MGTPDSGRFRDKRQENTAAPTSAPTPKPVAKPTSCGDFSTKYKELIDMAAGVSDENIAQIKVYVDALIDADVETLCDAAERSTLAGETKAKAEVAVKSTKDYTGEKETKVEELKKKVNEDIAKQNSVNEKLEERDEATVPTVAQTYAIQPTTPKAGAEKTPEGTPPADGKLPKALHQLMGKLPKGTPPADGKTPEGTPPADGKTPEGTPPADVKTPEGTPPADASTPGGVSTAKPPARLLFGKRSRGSLV